MRSLAIYCVDVGSVKEGRFGWARGVSSRGRTVVRRSSKIKALVANIAADLNAGRSVALGFECPLFVPVSDDPHDLTSARSGEGNRAWSAFAGPASLAVGLTEAVWVLREVRLLTQVRTGVFLRWETFRRARRGLFLWEAFVTSHAKTTSHARDAALGVRRFAASLPDVVRANAIDDAVVHSLIGAALLRTGWSRDLSLLETPCVVIKA